MAMNSSQENSFRTHMADGDWRMNIGINKENAGYYSDAKNHYYYAMREYEAAYDIARSAEDYRQHEAYRKARNAQNEFCNVMYRHDNEF